MATGGRTRLRVGVLFGGRSGEHEISIRSARFVHQALDRERFEPVAVGIDRRGAWHLHSEASFRSVERDAAGRGAAQVLAAPDARGCRLVRLDPPGETLARLDVIFPVLHGPYGEDGTVQGLLEALDVPYVGAGVLGSAVGMDKDVQKRLLREAGLPVVPFQALSDHDWQSGRRNVLARLGEFDLPLFVKPANLGSSLGIGKAASGRELEEAIERAFELDTKVVVERAVDAREIECAILGNDEPRASVPGEIVPGAEFYSYDAKYAAGSHARLLIPAPLPDNVADLVRTLAVRVFRVLECAGMARVDFFLERQSEQLYVNEINTLPGFTSISMYPKLWEASGVNERELTAALIALAVERHRAAARRRPS